MGTKGIADKLYGNVGADTFYYRMGDGADVIGNTKTGNEQTLFDKNDTLVLGNSKADTLLDLSSLTFTDKKNVLTITFSDNSKLTVNKTNATTPVNIHLASSHFGWEGYSAETKAADGDYNGDGYDFVYGIDEKKFKSTTSAENLQKGTLNITGAGTYVNDNNATVASYKTSYMTAEGKTESLDVAVVDARYVNSGLKNIGVDASSNTAVSLVGGVSALNVTMGSAGGTVEGGYQTKDGKFSKAFNDKFYANGSATLGTTFVLDKTSGGKDNIYDYDASRGDVLYFSSGKPSYVKYSKKSLTIGYDAKTVFVLNYTDKSKTFEDTTNIKIAYLDPTEDDPANINTETYYGWNTKDTAFSAYEKKTRDEHWNLVDGKYIYTGKNTIANEGLYGTGYTLQGDAIKDVNADYVPDSVNVDSSGVLSFQNAGDAENPGFYIDPAFDKFHIQGQAKVNGGEATTLKGGDNFTANGVTYKLANVDGNTVNGFELTYNNWTKTNKNTFVYFSDGFETENNASLGSAKSQFTLTGAISDIESVSDENNIFSKLTISASVILLSFKSRFTIKLASVVPPSYNLFNISI